MPFASRAAASALSIFSAHFAKGLLMSKLQKMVSCTDHSVVQVLSSVLVQIWPLLSISSLLSSISFVATPGAAWWITTTLLGSSVLTPRYSGVTPAAACMLLTSSLSKMATHCANGTLSLKVQTVVSMRQQAIAGLFTELVLRTVSRVTRQGARRRCSPPLVSKNLP